MTVMLPSLTAQAKRKDPGEEHNHTKAHIQHLEDEVDHLKLEQAKARADIDGFRAAVGNMDKSDFNQMQHEVEKHDTYFAILTAFTGITTAAILGEVIHRVATRAKSD
jgi:hypothetical protein